MNAHIMKEVATGVVPALVAGVIACVVIVLMRKGKPAGDARGAWIGALMLGVGCAVGAALAAGEWKPGVSGTTWLAAMAVVASVAGLVRGESERAGAARWCVVAAAFAGVAWMTMRSVAGLENWVRAAIIAGVALVGLAVCAGLERALKDGAGQRGGWPAAAVGMLVGFGASQVLIIGMAVHAAAWVAAGVSAFFGVCLAVGLLTRRALVGRGVLTAAGVLVCGLLLHGVELGNTGRAEAWLYAGLVMAGAVAPLLAAWMLGDRGRGWAGVIACAVPVMAAVGTAVVLRPPPLDEASLEPGIGVSDAPARADKGGRRLAATPARSGGVWC